eukprot:8165430-Pyramimonas_sp.AAC.1
MISQFGAPPTTLLWWQAGAAGSRQAILFSSLTSCLAALSVHVIELDRSIIFLCVEDNERDNLRANNFLTQSHYTVPYDASALRSLMIPQTPYNPKVPASTPMRGVEFTAILMMKE